MCRYLNEYMYTAILIRLDKPKTGGASAPLAPLSTPLPGQVECYTDLEFMEKLGAGGYGAVSKGRWISRNKIVAIKTSINFIEREVG